MRIPQYQIINFFIVTKIWRFKTNNYYLTYIIVMWHDQTYKISGRFGTYKRLLEAQYGEKLVLIPHYEFEILGNASDLPTQVQMEYVRKKLGLQ